MTAYLYPALFALFVWWFSTGVIIYLDGLPQKTFKWSMGGATIIFGVSLWGLADTADDTTVAGAYLAFTYGLLAWGWQEMSFYMGYVTGTRRESCPEGCSGWKHFGHAIQAILWHELTIIGTAVMLFWLTWGQPNQVGIWTFMVLWWMQLSAKLNVFLGVRNLNGEFLPDHMAFLKSYLTKKPMNLFFPISVTVSTVIAVILGQQAFAADPSSFEAAGYTFLTVLLALAILEHWFLVLPLPSAALWHWSLASRKPNQSPATEIENLEMMAPSSLLGDAASRPDDDRDTALGLKSWSTALAGSFSSERLHHLLEKIVAGDFGEVARVKGLARAGGGWVQFGIAGGRATMSAFAAKDDEMPRVVAIGKSVDEDGLAAAFQTCGTGAEPALV